MDAVDFYAVLGVDRTATPQEVRAAYRRLVRGLHPDGPGGKDADPARLREVLEAYSVLGDPGRRAAYDQALRRQEAEAQLQAGLPTSGVRVWPSHSILQDPELVWRILRWFP